MAGNVYKQYVWLLEQICIHDGIKFQDISDHWQRSELNETGAPLSRRTFHNHIDKIYEIFGIEIKCGVGYKYRIVWSQDINIKSLQLSLLSHLHMSNAMFTNPQLAERISMDSYLSFRYYMPLIKAMTESAVVEIHLYKKQSDEHYYLKVEPYYIKQFEHDWFVVGKERQSGELCAYSFREIVAIRHSLQGERFKLPTDFSATEFMHTPQLSAPTQSNSNEYYMECHTWSQHIRRSRWGSYIPEGYNPYITEEEFNKIEVSQ